MIDSLIMLADILDARGFHGEAEALDSIIKEAAEIHDIIQKRVEEEASPDQPSPRVMQLVLDLERTLQEKQRDPESKIDYDITEEVMQIVQNLLKENVRSYQTPGTGQAGASMWYQVQNDIIKLVDSVIELEDEIWGQGAYEGKEIDQKEYAKDFEKLKELYGIVSRIKSGEGREKDPRTYELMRNYYNERRGKEIW